MFLEIFHQPDFTSFIYLFIIIILLGCSGLISGSEVAFFSLSPSQLKFLETNLSSRKNKFTRMLLNNPKRLLATLLIANSLVNIAIVIISSVLTLRIFDFSANPTLGFIIQIVVVTFLIVLLGEVMPKVYATKKKIVYALRMSIPLVILDKLLSPISFLMVASTNFIDKRMKRRGYEVSMAELTHAIDITSDHSTPADEKKILKGIVRFGNMDVKQIMKPRIDVVAFENTLPFTKVIEKINESGYSRIPVYENNFDHITGILFIKDLVQHIDKDDTFKWTELIRQTYFVPESKKINDLLQEFQEMKIHLAVVIDEYGGNVGIVTLEDILEEIVGEMSDEFDDDEPLYSKLDDNNYVFEAKTLLNDICRVMQIDRSIFDEIQGETDTLAGLLLELSGRIPVKGEVISFKGIHFTIESADKRKIKRVKISKSKQEIENT